MGEELKTLVVERVDGTRFKLRVPASCKVTFGYFNPASSGGPGGYADKAGALRIYDSRERQRACFRDIRSFYEEGMSPLFEVRDGAASTWVDEEEMNRLVAKEVAQRKGRTEKMINAPQERNIIDAAREAVQRGGGNIWT